MVNQYSSVLPQQCEPFGYPEREPDFLADLCVYTGTSVVLSGAKHRPADVEERLVSQLTKREGKWLHMVGVVID